MAAGLVWRNALNGVRGGLLVRLPACVGLLLIFIAPLQAQQTADSKIRLSIVGGLAGVTQFARFEKPFWETDIGKLSNGRISATIRPFDGGGLRGQEMLQLMRLGVVPFGTMLLSLVSADEPELNAPDLPVLNPDMATLRKTVAVYREHLQQLLHQRYGIELLGVYTYPAQVLYCKGKFSGLGDIAGRKVRTSSVSQSELVTALGAVPVMVPFANIVPAVRDGVTDCAITGTLSGYEIGLSEVTTHVHAMALSWGLSFFGANLAAWNALPLDIQQIIRNGVGDLEARIWEQADSDTQRGLVCNVGTGEAICAGLPGGGMTLVISATDEARRNRLLKEVVLPRWIDRCGEACATAWDTYLAPTHGITAGTE